MQYTFSFIKNLSVTTITNESIIDDQISKEVIKKVNKLKMTDEQLKCFSLAFQYNRNKLGLTYKDLKKELGYSTHYIGSGNNRFTISFKRANDIADYFNMTLKDFISLGNRILKDKT